MSAHPDDNKVVLYDVTLRDGAQTPGVAMSLDDKKTIIGWLRELGLAHIEAGWPGTNPVDDELYENLPAFDDVHYYAFGMTHRKNVSAKEDGLLQGVIKSPANVCLFGKCWDVEKSLGVSPEQNCELIRSSVAEAVRQGKEAVFDAEHFFDGYKENPEQAFKYLEAAVNGGASWLVLCETRGAATPDEVAKAARAVKEKFPDVKLGIHAHNDFGMANANSLAAVQAGCRMVQGTLCGLGERAGNADLLQLIPLLRLKGYDVGVTDEQQKKITPFAKKLAERLSFSIDPTTPVYGEDAYCHQGGVHSKTPELYEAITPESVGNERRTPLSSQTGRENVIRLLRKAELLNGMDEKQVKDVAGKVLKYIKEKAAKGYDFKNAVANVLLHAKKVIHPQPAPFEVLGFSVGVETNKNLDLSTAKINVRVKGKTVSAEATSEKGPVNALDKALHTALEPYFPELKNRTLDKFDVKSTDRHEGTESKIRVWVEMSSADSDGDAKSWQTMGVSENILKASLEALVKGYQYYLCMVCDPRLKPEKASHLRKGFKAHAVDLLRLPTRRAGHHPRHNRLERKGPGNR